jgi:hypothetical protein
MQPQKNNAGNRISDTGTAKGFQSFGDYSTEKILEIAKELKRERLRRDNAALRLPPLGCGCRDPLRCRCNAGAA